MEEKRWLRTLGGLSLHRGGPEGEVLLGPSKSLAVLAYVALAPGREATRSHVASLLWPGDPQRGRRSLRQALYYLSKRAGTELLRSDDGTLRVAGDRVTVDARAFDRALEEGDLERAVELYGGPFLEGFGADGGREFESWAESQNERIWAGLKAACHELVGRALEAGEPDRAVEHARFYVEVNPLDEKARRMLIRAHLAAGDRVQAYRAYEAYRALLREELEDEPGEELRERMEALRDEIFGGVSGPVTGAGEAGEGPAEGEDRRSGGPLRWGVGAAPDDASRTEGADPSGGWRIAAVAMLAGLVAAAGALTLRGNSEDGAAPGWSGADGELRLKGRTGFETARARVRGGALASIDEVPGRDLPGPGGWRTAVRIRTPGGVDLAIVDRETGDTLVRTRRPADELPLAWSPDGARLLVRAGEPTEDGSGYRWRLALLDVPSGERRELPLVSHGTDHPTADWSPRGDRIALSVRDSSGRDLWVVDADGRRPRRVVDHPADDRHPAWSPDGSWLAFTSAHGATRDLHLVRPDGRGLERLTFGPADELAPAWLTDRHLVHAVDPGAADGQGEGELWLLDVPTRRTRTLTTGVDVTRIRPVPDEAVAGRRVERVRIRGGDRVAAPGQSIRLEAEVLDRRGERVPPTAAPVRWTGEDGGAARVEEDGTVQALGPGEARAVASVGGWRADTVRITVRETEVRSPPPVLSERWTEGIREDRWVAFGRPAPAVERLRPPSGSPPGASGPGPGAATEADAADGPAAAFVSNGDANFDSGVVSRQTFDLTRGLTVAFRARLPFSGKRYEALRVGIVRRPPPSPGMYGRFGGGDLGDLATVTLSRVDAEPRIRLPGRVAADLPALEAPERWHRYALQLEPDGRVSWVVDGRIRWRSSGPVLADRPDSARVALGGRSLHADLLVGPVTVRRGVRYALEE